MKMKTQNILTHYFAIKVLLIQFLVAAKKMKLKEAVHLGICFYEGQSFEITLNNIYSYSVQYWQ